MLWTTTFTMRQPPVELLSPLPLEVCCHLLDAQIDSSWRISGIQPLVGQRSGTWLRVRPRIAYRNSFQTHLTATLSAQGAQTLIRCEFGPHPFVIVFVVVWLTLVGSIGGTTLVTVLLALVTHPATMPSTAWPGVAIPIAMTAGGIGVVLIGRYLARDERDDMLLVVSRTLRATPRP